VPFASVQYRWTSTAPRKKMAPQVTHKTNNENRDLSPGVDRLTCAIMHLVIRARPRSPTLPDSTTNMLFLGRPISVNQYSSAVSFCSYLLRHDNVGLGALNDGE